MKLLVEAMEELRGDGLRCARGIADWYANNQVRQRDYIHGAGTFPSSISFIGQPMRAVTNWNLAFATMAQIAAGTAFGEDLYTHSARKMVSYLRALQIFDPFVPNHYGGIREMTAHTPWCYVRDALSGAWGFLEYYRVTGEEEYLERARLWAQWYFKNGCDDDGLPLWGVVFGEPISDGTPVMCNDMLGDFTGGNLNFFYQMYRATGDKQYIDERFRHFADFFLTRVQQPDGWFKTVRKSDGSVPESDPQGGLHRTNDDFASLGLLCAYRVTGEKRYIEGVKRFLDAVFATQREDGSFEPTCAGVPVVLNTMLEAEGLLGPWSKQRLEAARRALMFLSTRQNKGDILPNQRGALDEYGDGAVCTRSSAYALICLLKLFAGEARFLSAAE